MADKPVAHTEGASTSVSASLATSAAMAILGVDAGAMMSDYASYAGAGSTAGTMLSMDASGTSSSSAAASTTDTAPATTAQASGEAGAAAAPTTGLFMEATSSGHDLLAEKSGGDEKKMGRPSHPAWGHFVRGEKRNRFHHNAFCRYCTANGVNPPPVRGVSGNMIRHLQKCIYCPTEIVTQLKLLCAQKDAASFNKKHSAHNRDIDLLLHEPPAPTLRKKRKHEHEALSSAPGASGTQATGLRAAATSTATALASPTTLVNSGVNEQRAHGNIEEDFMPLQLPLLSSDLNVSAAPTSTASQPLGTPSSLVLSELTKPARVVTKTPAELASDSPASARLKSHDGVRRIAREQAAEPCEQGSKAKADAALFNKLVLTTSAVSGLPWDWVYAEEAARLLKNADCELDVPDLNALSLLGQIAQEKQMARMKMESIGVTLSVNLWSCRFPKSTALLLSLINASGEASVWDLVDIGIEYSSDMLVEKIAAGLTALQEKGTHVINIVVDSLVTYRAACSAVRATSWADQSIPVLPCFSHVLQLLLGGVLASSEALTDTMGEVIELVQMFTNQRVLTVLRRECGDPDASLVVPSTENWYSFIDCVDSVRQYEDMVKIVAAKVLDASSSCSDLVAGDSGTDSLPPPRTRKDSAGNTVDELAESGLSAAVIRSIQSHSFWERVVSLSELMSPIKESHKLMANSKVSASAFLLSDVFYQLGRMHQQYGAIISDWDENRSAGRSVEHVRFLQRAVNSVWNLYDQQLMVLSYVFNYNLHDPYLDRHHSALQWLAIGKSAKEYFRRWFCAASSTRNPSRVLGLSEEALAQFLEDLLAFKEHKYPFDPESVCDFENPKVFYMLISDSHPLMHLFGARLFSFVTTTPSLGEVVMDKHFLSSVPSTAYSPRSLLPVLEMTLFVQTSARGNAASVLQNSLNHSQSGRTRSVSDKTMASFQSRGEDTTAKGKSTITSERSRPSAKVWSKNQWIRLAKEWKTHWDRETDGGEFAHHPGGAGELASDVSLDQIFKEKLPSRLPRDREDAVVDV